MPELKLPFIGHGGDYNPDQWLDRPDLLEEDIRLMKLAGCNGMSVVYSPGPRRSPRRGISPSTGRRAFRTDCMRQAFPSSWPRPAARARRG